MPSYIEHRRLWQLLDRARAIGAPFEIRYTRLRGATGDERWRRGAGDRTVELAEDPAVPGSRRCVATNSSFGDDSRPLDGEACDARELALTSPPTRDVWLTHWLMATPNPIIDGLDDEVVCISIS